MASRRLRGRLSLILAAAALLATGTDAAQACDIPIHKAAAEEWPLDIYSLFYCTQKGLKANTGLEKVFKGAVDTWMRGANIDRIDIDVNRPMLQEDRELMAKRGIHPLPHAVLVDKDGKRVAEHNGRLDGEAWRTLSAAAAPVGPFKVLLFTRSHLRSLLPDPSEATPFPLTTIDLDEADTDHKALAKKLEVVEYRLPSAVLVDKNGTRLSATRGKLDAAAWSRFKAVAEPAGPCRVVAFTKTEIGSPVADGSPPAPMPLTIVDLDKADEQGRALAKQCNVVNLPFVSILSPIGTELASFGEALNDGDLRSLIQSPKRTEILKELGGKIAVLLFIESKDKKQNAEALKIVKDGIKRGTRLFEGKIGLVQINPGDKREECLFRNLRLKADGKKPMVVPIFGKGKVLAVPPLKGKFTSNHVLDYVQILMQNCSCVIRPSDLGEDLLMNWPVPKEPE